MLRSSAPLRRFLSCRSFSSTSSENIVAAVLFERLPVVIPKIDPVVYAFQEFSFRWKQQYRRKYPEEVLSKSDAKGKGDYKIDYEPAPRVTEADRTNDRREHLIEAVSSLYGNTFGSSSDELSWHFPEKLYESEESMRKCAESALKSRFFFKSQVVGADKYSVGKCRDFAWLTKDELIEHFPHQAAFLNQNDHQLIRR
ncbi:unnamed protein product [Spirodela intermedia]|uniref:Uncharacterized protein n=1 Tax=Spirodela intermedia TaxID=51605 RepID=A0A7I8JRK1_SPIIN|nr:unnamed protein product [Spirodela intermedia]CAA6672401.1 unnamed protein product [Spirodela intermedia]